MSAFILIVVISLPAQGFGGGAVAVSQHEYSSERECKKAGGQVYALAQAQGLRANFACVQK